MAIYNDIIIRAGLPIEDTIGGTKITAIDFKCILIEGHKGILEYSPGEIIIQLKKNRLIVSGNKLMLEEINIDEILIKGDIFKIEKDL